MLRKGLGESESYEQQGKPMNWLPRLGHVG